MNGTWVGLKVDPEVSVLELPLLTAGRNALFNSGLRTALDAARLTDGELMRIPGFGAKALRDLRSFVGQIDQTAARAEALSDVTLQLAGRLRDLAFRDEPDRRRFDRFLEETRAGSHPDFLRFMARVMLLLVPDERHEVD